MVMIPKVQKKINSFLTKEEGKISKENLVKAGIIITIFSSMLSQDADAYKACVSEGATCHNNNLNVTASTGTHGHHANYTAHGNHSSCGSGTW